MDSPQGFAMSQPAADSPVKVTSTVPSKKISVIQLLHTMAYGGIETIAINWWRFLNREKYDVHMVCFANPGETERPFVEAAARFGIQVDKIPWNRLKPMVRSTRALVRLVRKYDVDIIHTHNVYADIVGLLAAKWTGKKSLASHYVWGDFGLRLNLLQTVNGWVLPYFDHVTAQCERTLRDTVARGIRSDRVSTLGSGIVVGDAKMSPEERVRRRAAWGATEENTVLLDVARLYPEKAQRYLLDCFRQILDHFPQARLWIAGVGPLENELRAHCSQLGLDQAVRWLGFVSDLSSLFALADIQVHPALNEGIPIALLQGMAAGMPVVASAVGGIPEILDGRQGGLLVPVNDKAAFVESVISLLKDPERARNLGTAAREYIVREQSIAHAVSELEQRYGELVRGAPLRGAKA